MQKNSPYRLRRENYLVFLKNHYSAIIAKAYISAFISLQSIDFDVKATGDI